MIVIAASTLGLILLAAAVLIVQLGFILTLCVLIVILAVAASGVIAFVCFARGIFYDRRKSEANI